MFSQPRQRSPQTSQAMAVPAPARGIIAVDSLYGTGNVGLDSAILLWNMVPGEYGCRLRRGSFELAYGLRSALGDPGEVRTVVLYDSIEEGSASDKLFAFTDRGIYDITLGGDFSAIDPVLTWPVQGGDAGWAKTINYTNVGGDHYLLITDEENGYYIYDGLTFAQGTFTGSPAPDAAVLVDVTEWNGRIWFVERYSARAWYLNPLELTGNITELDVGNRFLKGGHLVQNTTWTLDDGAGMNDRLVQISSAGDILVWQGINPEDPSSLDLIGRWSIGEVPAGRRVMSDWGGDVTVLNNTGVTRLSFLMSDTVGSLKDSAWLTNNVDRYFRRYMRDLINEHGWGMELFPAEGLAVISVPDSPLVTSQPVQFALEINSGTWCMFRDLDMACMDDNVKGFMFGSRDGRVMSMQGYADDAGSTEKEAKPINFSLLSHYSDLGMAAQWKRGQFIRPHWLATTDPIFDIKVVYDFKIDELLVSPIAETLSETGEWDLSLWDAAIWGGGAQDFQETLGAVGHGRHVGVALRGSASSGLSYLGADLIMDAGGLL